MEASIHPSGHGLGAEINGLDLSNPASRETMQWIEGEWFAHQVLLIRNQSITDEDLVAFSRWFGALDHAPINEATNKLSDGYAPELPEVSIISNVKVNGVPIGALGAGEAEWHTDMSYVPDPPIASILYSVEVPEEGGDTSFLNMYAAFDDLSDEIKNKIGGKECVHDASLTSTGDLRKGFEPVTDVTKTVGARHPLVIVHPNTRRRALYLGRRTNAYIPGLSVGESEALLDILWTHIDNPSFTWTHRWQKDDLLMWDNRVTMHRRDGFDENVVRIMHRTQVRAETTDARTF